MKKINNKIYLHQFTLSHIQQVQLIQAIEGEHSPLSRLSMQTNGWTTRKMNGGTAQAYPLKHIIHAMTGMLNDIAGKCAPVNYWFVALEKGGLIGLHDHHQTDWAAAFYPEGVDGEGGRIIFEDGTSVRPIAGQALFFPGDLKHRVTAHDSDRTRYSIAMNRLLP